MTTFIQAIALAISIIPEDGETIYEDAYDQYQAITMAHNDFHSIVELDLIKVV